MVQIPKLYRLYNAQTIKGSKIATYVYDGDYSNPEIVLDALEIARKIKTWKYLTEYKKSIYQFKDNRKKLLYYVKIFKKARLVIESNPNVDKAIFVKSKKYEDWRGKKTIYYNKYFDEMKTNIPSFSGCIPLYETII